MAKKAKKPPEPDVGSPAWMTTFGDLMSLLLTFFVLIVSMSSIQESKFMVAIDSFRRALSWYEGQPPEAMIPKNVSTSSDLDKEKSIEVPREDEYIIAANNIINIAKEMQTKIEQLNIAGQLQVYHNDREVRIYIEDIIMFENGSAEIRGKEALYLLESIISLVEDIPYPLNIEGHTAKMQLSSGDEAFDTEWELASARALAVLHYLHRNGISSKRLKTISYGANMPKESGNSVPEHLWKNNRVEIVIRDTSME